MRENCPDCGLAYEHRQTCTLYGMDSVTSSLLFGYPTCQCCGLEYGPERTELHAKRGRGGPGLGTLADPGGSLDVETMRQKARDLTLDKMKAEIMRRYGIMPAASRYWYRLYMPDTISQFSRDDQQDDDGA